MKKFVYNVLVVNVAESFGVHYEELHSTTISFQFFLIVQKHKYALKSVSFFKLEKTTRHN